jgi:curved DNA-binding protein CbpA
LGIAPSSTEAEINKAYRKMALKVHPDKNPGNLIDAKERFIQLGAALEVIKDPTHVGGKNRSHRVYRRRNTRHTKRSNKSSKSSKRYSKTHRR